MHGPIVTSTIKVATKATANTLRDQQELFRDQSYDNKTFCGYNSLEEVIKVTRKTKV